MVKNQNKKAHPFIRILASIIDSTLFLIFAIFSSFMVFNYRKGIYYHIANYYVWLFLLISFLIFFYIVLPIIWKGKTIGKAICKIKLIQQDEKEKFSNKVFDSQRLFSFLWVCILTSFIFFISPNTFIQVSKRSELKLYQKVFLTIPTVLSSLTIITELVFLFSVFSERRIGLNDKFSNTLIVWENKFDEEDLTSKKNLKIKKIPRKLAELDFMN
ncbi:membrane protein [Metamycoplasma hyosynoviae]|nr:RDD family protein [Metamycoplasma hyosynoviae]KDE44890.1 membrane protein [Metamycoplasma hyosynoviae]